MTKIAEENGLSRSSLSKAWSDGAKPKFETIMKVLQSTVQIQVNLKSVRKNNAPTSGVQAFARSVNI